MIAGAWSLLSDGVPSEQEAEQCIACHDWQSVSEGREVNDELLCLQTILQRQVRVEANDRPITRTLGELVELAAQQAHELESNYTKPTMRKQLFNSIKAGGKGGAPGQWSARKAQMLAKQYKAKGGGYK